MRTLSNAVYDAVKYRKTLPGRIRARFLKSPLSANKTNAITYVVTTGMALTEFMSNEGYTWDEISSLRVA